MIVRSIVARQSRQAFASTVPRTCSRFISLDTSTTGLTMDAVESLNSEAANETFDRRQQARKETQSFLDRTKPLKNDDAVQQWRDYNTYKKKRNDIGSVVTNDNKPLDLMVNPPSAADITLELLMASQTHMGHHTSRWKVENSQYIYGVRHGIHIISLETTAAHLRRAARVVEEVAFRGGLLLFVGTRKGHMDIITQAAEMAGACRLYTRWTPGMITNRDIIQRDRMVKVVNEKDEHMRGFGDHERDRRALVPDLVVCLNPLENKTLLAECALASVPTIGIIDTDCDPSLVTYTIPGNDDSLRSAALVAGVLGRAGEAGQKRRKAAAEDGIAEWSTPEDTKTYMRKQTKKWEEEMEQWELDMAALANADKPSNGERLLDIKGVVKGGSNGESAPR